MKSIVKWLLDNKTINSKSCWIHTRVTSKTTNGYIQAVIKGKSIQLHRLSYQMFNGPIHEGLLVLHRCNNKICFNPEHLYLGTQSDNVRQAVKDNLQTNASKRFCKRGHEFTPENIYPTNGGRGCRICRLDYSRKYIRKKETSNA